VSDETVWLMVFRRSLRKAGAEGATPLRIFSTRVLMKRGNLSGKRTEVKNATKHGYAARGGC
jgi:hypothetical protein